MINFNN